MTNIGSDVRKQLEEGVFALISKHSNLPVETVANTVPGLVQVTLENGGFRFSLNPKALQVAQHSFLDLADNRDQYEARLQTIEHALNAVFHDLGLLSQNGVHVDKANRTIDSSSLTRLYAQVNRALERQALPEIAPVAYQLTADEQAAVTDINRATRGATVHTEGSLTDLGKSLFDPDAHTPLQSALRKLINYGKAALEPLVQEATRELSVAQRAGEMART